MSEVDRLSNSGVFPALPVGDKRRDGSDSPGRQPPGGDPSGDRDRPDPHAPHPPKSIIDEYA